jgi:adenine-specific DNA glycosylase
VIQRIERARLTSVGSARKHRSSANGWSSRAARRRNQRTNFNIALTDSGAAVCTPANPDEAMCMMEVGTRLPKKSFPLIRSRRLSKQLYSADSKPVGGLTPSMTRRLNQRSAHSSNTLLATRVRSPPSLRNLAAVKFEKSPRKKDRHFDKPPRHHSC